MSEINFSGLALEDLARLAEWSANPKIQQAAKDQLVEDSIRGYYEDAYRPDPDDPYVDEARSEGIEEGQNEVMDILEDFFNSDTYFGKKINKKRVDEILADMASQFPTHNITRVKRGS